MDVLHNHTVQEPQDQGVVEQDHSGSTSAPSANGHTVASTTLRAQIVQNINATCAVITGTANMGKILVEEVNPVTGLPDITIVTKDQLKNRLANRFISSNTGRRNTFNIWWQSSQRREVKGIVFDPTGEISDQYYNLWRRFAVEPVPGDWSLFQQHIREVIASGDEEIYHYIIHWLADLVQRPTDKPGVSLVLQGIQGVGKGVFVTECGKLFGPHFKHVKSSEHMLGTFNNMMKDALLVFADEAFWAGDKKAAGLLKTMVTEPTITIRPLYREAFEVPNYIHLMIASNAKWIIPADSEERRFCVLNVSDVHMQDTNYFAALTAQMENGGRAALLHHLLNEVDLDGVNLRNFPRTEALFEQMHESMEDEVQRFWLEMLSRGSFDQIQPSHLDWPEALTISCDALYDLYKDFIGDHRRKLTNSKFGKELKKWLPPGFRRVQVRVGVRKPYFYQIPSLADCRAHFQAKVNAPIAWPAAEEGESSH